MFKNIQVYRMTSGWHLDVAAVEHALAQHSHCPIGASQELSVGWVPVQDDKFAHSVGGQMLLYFKTEVRKVPGAVLKKRVQEHCDELYTQTGRKPGKKERREITEDMRMALLPQVLPTESQVAVWIDPKNGWIVLNTGSQSVSDRVITWLVKALDKLSLQTLVLARSAGSVMTEWLAAQEGPVAFAINRACELKACDESKAVVRYTNSTLDTDNLREHIKQGKVCTSLALTWNDRVSFVITDQFKIKKIKFLDVVFEDNSRKQDNGADSGLDADFAIMTGELTGLLSELVQAFGGEEPRDKPAPSGDNNDLF